MSNAITFKSYAKVYGADELYDNFGLSSFDFSWDSDFTAYVIYIDGIEFGYTTRSYGEWFAASNTTMAKQSYSGYGDTRREAVAAMLRRYAKAAA